MKFRIFSKNIWGPGPRARSRRLVDYSTYRFWERSQRTCFLLPWKLLLEFSQEITNVLYHVGRRSSVANESMSSLPPWFSVSGVKRCSQDSTRCLRWFSFSQRKADQQQNGFYLLLVRFVAGYTAGNRVLSCPIAKCSVCLHSFCTTSICSVPKELHSESYSNLPVSNRWTAGHNKRLSTSSRDVHIVDIS